MTDVVIVALITGGFSFVATLCGILVSNKLTLYRIEQLEKKVDKHNNVVERMYKLEEKTNLIDERQKVANHRIDDLENSE